MPNRAAFLTTCASTLNPGADNDWKRDRTLAILACGRNEWPVARPCEVIGISPAGFYA